jgi:tetratricopeptide (TPR) repeat protein
MPDNPRIEDLRRRIQKDPTSIAFAQLAEEYRRAGQYTEAVDVCRAGLAVHAGYLSARVTLGRALLELGHVDEAKHDLERVLKSAPENLAAIRGLAEIHHRRGELVEALAHYKTALSLARNDPDLEETVSDLTRRLTPQGGPEPADGLSFDQMRHELAVTYVPTPPTSGPKASPPARTSPAAAAPVQASVPQTGSVTPPLPAAPRTQPRADPQQDRLIRTVAVLDQWLAAIHVARADGRP